MFRALGVGSVMASSVTVDRQACPRTTGPRPYLRYLLPLLMLAAFPAVAHVGSPDVYYEGDAGPYHLFVTVKVPPVVPGVAQVEVRSQLNDVTQVGILALGLTGAGAKYPPSPETTERSKQDPQFFTGNLWLMEFGSLQVRVAD